MMEELKKLMETIENSENFSISPVSSKRSPISAKAKFGK